MGRPKARAIPALSPWTSVGAGFLATTTLPATHLTMRCMLLRSVLLLAIQVLERCMQPQGHLRYRVLRDESSADLPALHHSRQLFRDLRAPSVPESLAARYLHIDTPSRETR